MSVSVSPVRGSRPTTLLDGADDAGRKCSVLEALINGERETLSSSKIVGRDQVNVKVMDDDLHRVENTARQRGASPDDVVKDPGRFGLSAGDVTRYQIEQKTQEGLLHDLGIDTSQDHRRYSQIPEAERRHNNLRPTMLWAYDPTAFNGKGKAADHLEIEWVRLHDARHTCGTLMHLRGCRSQ